MKPDINKSGTKFTVENGKIRFGLGSIKNVGIAPVDNIVNERKENGVYTGFVDFCERISTYAVNKKCIESLIKAGAFNEFEQNRATLLASFETIIDAIQNNNKKGLDGQVSMFDLGTDEEKDEMKKNQYNFEEREEFSNKELLSMEKEMLGIYLSGHPLEKLRHQIELQTNINTMQFRQINEEMSSGMEEEEVETSEKPKFVDGQKVIYAGIITSIKKKYTKNNKLMAFVTVEDLYGTAEIIVFENAYMNAGDSLAEENIVKVEGRLSIREDEDVKIVANEIKTFDEQKQKVLTLDITDEDEEVKSKLRGAIRYFSGDKNNINVRIKMGEELKPCGQIYLTDQILLEFQDILSREKAFVEEI